MNVMAHLGSMPLITTVVFFIGISLGYAWQNGLIPIELGNPKTGTVASNSEASTSDDSVEGDNASENETSVTEILQASATLPEDEFEVLGNQHDPDASDSSTSSSSVELAQFETPNPATRPLLENHQVQNSKRTANQESATSQSDSWLEETPAREQIESATPEPKITKRVRQAAYFDIEPENGQPPRSSEQPARKTPQIATSQDGIPSKSDFEKDNLVDTVPSDPMLAAQLKVIDEQITNGETLAAHRALSKLYWDTPSSRTAIRSRIEGTARTIFFEPRPHFVDPYTVEPNDQLRVIANKYQISWEYLSKLNRTDPRRIQLGQKLKVVKGPFSAVVDLHEYALTIHLQGYYVKRYEVGIGKDGSSPTGKFPVLNKVENPQYTGPDGKVIAANDPSNPLGERWLDLGNSYGIHGTIEPDSIGKAASRGCVRMRDKDIVEVYDFLIKGSEVTIRE